MMHIRCMSSSFFHILVFIIGLEYYFFFKYKVKGKATITDWFTKQMIRLGCGTLSGTKVLNHLHSRHAWLAPYILRAIIISYEADTVTN